MQKNIKKRGAIISAVCVIGIALMYLLVILSALVNELYGNIGVVIFVLFYAAIIGAVVWGVCLALRQRLKEIEKGEEEDAKQY